MHHTGAFWQGGTVVSELEENKALSPRGSREGADLLGLSPGMVVQELGWDEDVDDDLRQDIMDIIDADMVDDALEAVEVVLLWWRDEDGDVADGLVDAITDLADDGWIWLVTPKVGRVHYIETGDIAEGVDTAGLTLTSSVSVSEDWQAHKVVRPKNHPRG